MKVTRQDKAGNAIHRLTLEHPIPTGLVLLVVALGFRVVDIFVLRLDERWSEIFLSKSLALALVLVFLWLVRAPVREIGLHARRLGGALLIPAIAMNTVFLAGYGAQLLALRLQGARPTLVFAAIDPKTGLAGGVLFGAWLLLGNVVNSFMEEGLFRGLLLRLFRTRLAPWRANALQAALFASWHLVWPVKHLVAGDTGALGAATEGASLLVATFVAGLFFGVLYEQTGSLWAPWLAHTMNNSVLNLVHVRLTGGFDENLLVLQLVVVSGLACWIPIAKLLARRSNMPEVEPWGA